MREIGILVPLLALVFAAGPADAFERERAAARESMSRALDELGQIVEAIDSSWRDYLGLGDRWDRPLISLMLRHREELGLTPPQVQRLERLRDEFQRESIRREADIRVAESELESLMREDAVSLPRVEGKLREVERLRADLRFARIRAIEQGKAQLTVEQRERLHALLADPWSSWRPRTGAPTPAPGLRPRPQQL
jgi:Spy/CpxP family protein refolding chaperone